MELITRIGKEMVRMDYPQFGTGDTIKVHVRIKEGEKERIQIFQGVVLGRHNNLSNTTITVRKVSYGVGVERIFFLNSPTIEKIELVTRGKVRRSKIYYLRNLRGKAARLKERRAIR